MTPTQDFENYPEFANSGQKSQPNDAKYAAGFIPSDVLPAEWLNWFLNGATKGVTALNTGVKSVEQEINAVLESRAVTPNINAAGQLLSVLNKIKAEAINDAWPIGITYVQYPQQKSPQELFPKTTWEEISYDGAFFRASGGNAADFIEKSGVLSKQEQSIKSHGHSASFSGNTRNGEVYLNNNVNGGSPISSCSGVFSSIGSSGINLDSGAWSSRPSGFRLSITPSGSVSIGDTGDKETRPDNYTIRIWKRTA